MKSKIFYGLGALIAGALTLAAVANGPYYAFPAWAQKLVCATTSNCPRFIVLADWNSEAVLDRETGLVWHKSPDGTSRAWSTAQDRCNRQLIVGNRMGWRLPTIQELTSLVDPSVSGPGPLLPAGHPFTTVQASSYWSATTFATDTGDAWIVDFHGGFIALRADKEAELLVWCVRGGQGVDPQ